MPDISNSEQQKVTLFSVLLMILTSIHHVYGAIAYSTPWRLHVLFFSVPVIILTLVLDRLLASTRNNHWVFRLYWVLTLVASIIVIGLFEGLYNHVLKNILFVIRFPENDMEKLYPHGIYEMPDNLFFEITGILQGVIAIVLIAYFIRLIRNRHYQL
jgi:ABC-type proline/glycine betaine transport system permease subunit